MRMASDPAHQNLRSNKLYQLAHKQFKGNQLPINHQSLSMKRIRNARYRAKQLTEKNASEVLRSGNISRKLMKHNKHIFINHIFYR